MDGSLTRWDNWSAEQWLEAASRFDKIALRFDYHPQLNASFRALARDAIVRAKDGQLTEAQVVRGTHWLHPHRRHPATDERQAHEMSPFKQKPDQRRHHRSGTSVARRK